MEEEIENQNQIILPGQKINLTNMQNEDLQKIKITQQFDYQSNQLVTNASGNLQVSAYTDQYIFAIKQNTKKYFEEIDDFVIGVVKQKLGEKYIVNINGSQDGQLGIYEFEGATKKNRPQLQIGTAIYARVMECNQYLRTELTCKSKTNKKEWVTGEAIFGELRNGIIFDISIYFAKQLINQKYKKIFKELKKYFSFEIAVGINGKFWLNLKSQHIRNTILLSNIIKYIDKNEFNEYQSLEYIKANANLFKEHEQ